MGCYFNTLATVRVNLTHHTKCTNTVTINKIKWNVFLPGLESGATVLKVHQRM